MPPASSAREFKWCPLPPTRPRIRNRPFRHTSAPCRRTAGSQSPGQNRKAPENGERSLQPADRPRDSASGDDLQSYETGRDAITSFLSSPSDSPMSSGRSRVSVGSIQVRNRAPPSEVVVCARLCRVIPGRSAHAVHRRQLGIVAGADQHRSAGASPPQLSRSGEQLGGRHGEPRAVSSTSVSSQGITPSTLG